MKRLSILILLIAVPALLLAGRVSIYDIQFTNNPGSDGTYPSPFRGQTVATSGIVIAIDLHNGGFYISEPQGGPWRGIYVQENVREVRIGDYIHLTGEVSESFGYTLIRNVSELQVVTSGNQLPQPYQVSTGELAQTEAYEGVLVRISNVTVAGVDTQTDLRLVNDGSGICRINERLLSSRNERNIYMNNELYTKIVGIVDYRFGEYRLNPRNLEDFARSPVGVSKPSWGRIKYLYR